MIAIPSQLNVELEMLVEPKAVLGMRPSAGRSIRCQTH